VKEHLTLQGVTVVSGVSANPQEGEIVFTPESESQPIFDSVDAVVHLAGLTPHSRRTPTEADYARVNKGWTLTIAEQCLERSLPLLFFGTSLVYGDAKGELVSEDDACDPRDLSGAYERDKRETEQELIRLSREGLSVSMVRLGSVFGASRGPLSPTRANAMLKQAFEGVPLTVFSELLHERKPYTHVEDVARATYYFLTNGLFSGEIYNLGSQNATTQELIDTIREIAPTLVVDTKESGRVPRSYGFSMNRLHKTGFQEKETLAGGLRALWEAFQK
jgi:nucleoside-diphosphate-sugar epimerase